MISPMVWWMVVCMVAMSGMNQRGIQRVEGQVAEYTVTTEQYTPFSPPADADGWGDGTMITGKCGNLYTSSFNPPFLSTTTHGGSGVTTKRSYTCEFDEGSLIVNSDCTYAFSSCANGGLAMRVQLVSPFEEIEMEPVAGLAIDSSDRVFSSFGPSLEPHPAIRAYGVNANDPSPYDITPSCNGGQVDVLGMAFDSFNRLFFYNDAIGAQGVWMLMPRQLTRAGSPAATFIGSTPENIPVLRSFRVSGSRLHFTQHGSSNFVRMSLDGSQQEKFTVELPESGWLKGVGIDHNSPTKDTLLALGPVMARVEMKEFVVTGIESGATGIGMATISIQPRVEIDSDTSYDMVCTGSVSPPRTLSFSHTRGSTAIVTRTLPALAAESMRCITSDYEGDLTFSKPPTLLFHMGEGAACPTDVDLENGDVKIDRTATSLHFACDSTAGYALSGASAVFTCVDGEWVGESGPLLTLAPTCVSIPITAVGVLPPPPAGGYLEVFTTSSGATIVVTCIDGSEPVGKHRVYKLNNKGKLTPYDPAHPFPILCQGGGN